MGRSSVKVYEKRFGDNLQIAVLHLDEKDSALAFSVIVRGKVVKTIQKSERGVFRRNIVSTQSVGGLIFSETFILGTPSIIKNWG